MVQQKSENGIVSQTRRKAGETERGKLNHPWGEKAVSVNERWIQLELPFGKVDKSGKPPESSTPRVNDRSTAQREEVPMTKENEERNSIATMEQLITLLRPAFSKVASNKGAPGSDRQTIKDVEKDLDRILTQLSEDLMEGNYIPGNIRRVYIPKASGDKRGLGIPNVIDRIVQEAIRQLIEPIYEPFFHSSSHGFRPNRSCHTAIEEAIGYIEEGKEWVVDLDLEKYFDTVNHDRLLSKLREDIHDRRIHRLIKLMLKAKVVMPDGVITRTDEGVPQGGPLSPLLSNIVLDELDRELTRRGHQFVRYADDCNIYVKSERAGHRVMESITRFIEQRLRLKVNREKSAVSRTGQRHFLGFHLRRDPLEGEVQVSLSKRSKKRIRERIKELTPRNWGVNLKTCINRLNRYIKGWFGFFRICTSKGEFSTLDGRIRRRLRCFLLKQWKRKRTIARKLIQRGSNRKSTWKRVYMNSRSWWSLSRDLVVHRGLRNAYFAEEGLASLVELWEAKRSSVVSTKG